jgi:EAL domain-containing protein (putative c-di-GMP-specific phosphodiesterase class I)
MSDLDAHRWKIVKAAIEDGRVAFVRETIVPLQPSSSDGYYELTPRMRDGRTGFVAKDFIVDEAEEFGTEHCVHRWVIPAALLWLREEPSADVNLCFIRLASQCFMDEQFGAFVIQMLHESKVDPQRLCFEIGERDVLVDETLMQRFIRPLWNWGVGLRLTIWGRA